MLTSRVLARIYGKKRGWCFTPKDFLDLENPSTVWQTLSRLAKKGTIRKILRGVYDYPPKNDFTEGLASPDPDRVAQTIARNSGWNIIPDGNTALNILRLSTQLPASWSYYSDGPSRIYEWEGVMLQFQRRAVKETAGLSYKSAILVQGIKALGKDNIDKTVFAVLRTYCTDSEWIGIIKECRYVTAWVYEVIKMVANVESEND